MKLGTNRLTRAGGLLGAALVARTSLAAWCDRRGIANDLRSAMLPMVSMPYNSSNLPLWRSVFRLARWSGPKVTVRTRTFGDAPATRVRVTTPTRAARTRPVVIWLHSGGMIAGSPQFEGPTAGMLARRLDAVVVAPHYRLAPEDPFPAALNDCVNTVKWVRTHARQLRVDPERIALAGASAGGGLAMTCAQRCQDEGIDITALALLYPMLDDQAPAKQHRPSVAWSAASNEFAWASYMGHTDADQEPRYSAASKRTDLCGTPPTFIAVGEIDVLCAQSAEYARRLREAGSICELVVLPGFYHAADLLVPWAKPVREVHSRLIEHLSRHLKGPAPRFETNA